MRHQHRFKQNAQQGATIVTTSLWLMTLIGLTALAFDIGHLVIVRNELQNAADAAALAGANCLDKTSAVSGTDCTKIFASTLNWTVAGTKATNAIALNKSDNTSLSTGTVQTGYWNLNGGTTMQPTTLSPIGPCTVVGGVMTTACDKPAVRVTLSRADGVNGGAVGTLVGMFGGSRIPLSASAIAVISNPGMVLPGNLMPIAINRCMYGLYWDSTTNTPRNATAATLNGVPQTIGQPWELRIGSSYHYGTCDSGQWTSFTQDVNDTPTIRDLINNGNPDLLSIGQNTWIEPGTKSAVYDTLASRVGQDVAVVVVNVPSGLDSAGATPVVAFAGFHIDSVNKSSKYVQGHFIKTNITVASSGVGPAYGTYTPPRLAQ